MKQLSIPFFATNLLLFTILLSSCEKSMSPNISDIAKEEISELKNRTKDDILNYFKSLIKENKIVVGQHCGDGPGQVAPYYDRYVESLAAKTGKYVGLIGADLGWRNHDSYPVDKLIDHWNHGGLVTISWHADNPFTEGYNVRINSVENRSKINLKSLVKGAKDSNHKTNYRNELDVIAKVLQKLKAAKVTVIWRPLHEMNGDFFWWGINEYNNKQTNVEDYRILWKDMHQTLTEDYGLDNLIWTYSSIPDLGWNANALAYFPGANVVDLVGLDYYHADLDFSELEAFTALDKNIPVVLSEVGPSDGGYGNWDEIQLVNLLKGKAAYFLQWHSWTNAEVAIIDNKKYVEMMNSDVVITLDEM